MTKSFPPAGLRAIDHITCVVRPDTIRQWAWFYIEVLGGVLTLRTDDTNPSGDSSMMVWTIDFGQFGVALIAGIDRAAKSHVTSFVEAHGDHSFQHLAFQVTDLDGLCSRLSACGVQMLGDSLLRKDAAGRMVKQVFGRPFHDEANSSVVAFYEFVERSASTAAEISFSEKAGELLYLQAQSEMLEDRRVPMTRFSEMPEEWQVPEPRPSGAAQGAVEVIPRRGRREADVDPIEEIRRWQSYRSANSRFPDARAAELDEMCRLARIQPGETVAEIGAGSGALTYRLAAAAGPGGRLFTYDVSRDNLVSVMLGNEAGLPITPVPQPPFGSDRMFPSVAQFDCIATLATFHHFDDRTLRSGDRGRRAAAAELHSMLKPGGRLILGDVAAGTAPQRYFDAIDDPQRCYPRGHPHDFSTATAMEEILKEAGFVQIHSRIQSVPWSFGSRDEAAEFLRVMHNARCSLEEVLVLAQEHLGFESLDGADGRCALRWELLFVEALKP